MYMYIRTTYHKEKPWEKAAKPTGVALGNGLQYLFAKYH